MHVERVRSNSAAKQDRGTASPDGRGRGGCIGDGNSNNGSGGGDSGGGSGSTWLELAYSVGDEVQSLMHVPYPLSALAWVLLVWIAAVLGILGAAAWAGSDSVSGGGGAADSSALSPSQARGFAIIIAYTVCVGAWSLQQDAPLISTLLLFRPWASLKGHSRTTTTTHGGSSAADTNNHDHDDDYANLANKALMYLFGGSRSVSVPREFAVWVTQQRARHDENDAQARVPTHVLISFCSASASAPTPAPSFPSLPPLPLTPSLPPPPLLAHDPSAARLKGALPRL